MINKNSTRRVLIVLAFLLFTGNVRAIAGKVVLDVKCPDSTIKYNIESYSRTAIESDGEHKVVASGSAEDVRISMSVVTVKTQGNSNAAPLGVGLAVLVRKRSSGKNIWKVTDFQNSFIPLDNLETAVQSVIHDALR